MREKRSPPFFVSAFHFSWFFLRGRLRLDRFDFEPIGYRASSGWRTMFLIVARYRVGSDVG
ncbi:hypothetical protein C266_14702 [Pandoraea sp. SD6-2]|nr:hypothetical protein C266_14702 [Pandoraea sp. SD6-2]